jgi:hypothetical protein
MLLLWPLLAVGSTLQDILDDSWCWLCCAGEHELASSRLNHPNALSTVGFAVELLILSHLEMQWGSQPQ